MRIKAPFARDRISNNILYKPKFFLASEGSKSEPKYSFCWYPGKIDTATLIKEETNEKEKVVPQHKSVWILTPTELYNEHDAEECEEYEESEEEYSESESEPKDTVDDVEAYIVYLNKDGDRCLREIKDCKH